MNWAEQTMTSTVPKSGDSHGIQLSKGVRFSFGENWAGFLSTLDDQRIAEAESNLKDMLEVTHLREKTFLDAGSGSGLFSLAARRLGAKVVSFDYDPQSVACTVELRRRYFDGDPDWNIHEGSVLDEAYLKRMGQFDVVYSWGVLHHTGEMWRALKYIDGSVAPGGSLFVAIYNDQGTASRRWLVAKKIYNRLPKPIATIFAVLVYIPFELKHMLAYLIKGTPAVYVSNIKHYKQQRGMSWIHDKIDWIGGLPFEVAKPEEIFEFYKALGYRLTKMTTNGGGHACNQFVFRRDDQRQIV
jgi:2-polyprenyl-6-hydroxyphenyl methylase/3-demethylubiquinone-9 3-methyltransferase